MTKPRCYIASPLGFTDEGRAYYYDIYLPALAGVVEPVDPWALSSLQDYLSAYASGATRAWALEVARRNTAAIASCAMLVAHLNGQEPDSGTVAEIGYAAALGLTCFGLRNDLRQSGEPGVAVNLQVEGFIYQSGGCVVASLEDLVGALAAYGH